MSTITTRAGKGSPLTNNEVDANFTNLNTDKAELSGAAFTGAITTNSTVDGVDIATRDAILTSTTATADAALPKTGGAMTGAITTNSTFDGVDIATRDAVLTSTTTTADAALPKAGGAMTGAITTNSTFDGRDVATDGTKLDGIEAGATADQTDAEIRAAVEAATDSNVFTDADHSKLNAIEALADVTDTANVTAAGALMDSELTSEASVKALNQGVATTDSPTFVGLTTSGEITANGGIALGDGDELTLGDSDEFKIKHHASGYTHLQNTVGTLYIDSDSVTFRDDDGSPSNMVISQTGIDVTGTATMDGLDLGATTDAATVSTTPADYQLQLGAANSTTGDIGQNISFGTGGNVTASINSYDAGSSAATGLAFFTGTSSTLRRYFNITAGGDVSLYENTGTTPKFFWDASAESLGIGTSSPSTRLTVGDGVSSEAIKVNAGSGWADLRLHSASANGGSIYFNDGADAGQIFYYHVEDSMRFHTATEERIRIDSSGNFLHGKTGLAIAQEGIVFERGGAAEFTTDAARVMRLNRTSSDGSVLEFNKDGTTVGSIGTKTGSVYIGTGDAGIGFNHHGGGNLDAIMPYSITAGAFQNGAVDIGGSSNRFKDLYLSSGVYLGGTGAANKLDDYEEGTWTLASTTTGVTISSQSCRYTKVGRLVTLTGSIIFSALPSNISTMSLSGAPFNCWGEHTAGIVREVTAVGAIYVLQINANSTSFGMNSYSGVANGSARIFAINEGYNFSLTYTV